jgi:two-component system chemotaxis response regulator CheY
MSGLDRRARVLVADDAAFVRKVMEDQLAGSGHEVVAHAGTGAAAIAAFEEHHPDVTILDLNMPDGDGLATAEAIRAVDPGARLLIASVFGGDPRLERLQELGVEFVAKPFARDDLRAAVERAFSPS